MCLYPGNTAAFSLNISLSYVIFITSLFDEKLMKDKMAIFEDILRVLFH